MKKLDLVGGNQPSGYRYELFSTAYDFVMGGAFLLRATTLRARAIGITTRFSVEQIEAFMSLVARAPKTAQYERIVDVETGDEQAMLSAAVDCALSRYDDMQAEKHIPFDKGQPGFHAGALSDICKRLTELFGGPSEGQAQRS